MSLVITRNGKEITKSEVEAWERKRAKRAANYLQKITGQPKSDITRNKNGDRKIEDIRLDLVEMKLNLGENKLRELLGKSMKSNDKTTAFMMKLSGKKRVFSIIEIEGTGATAKYMLDHFTSMMLDNSNENYYKCLLACPDHYILRGAGGSKQEIIESPAEMSQISRFTATYGDESGLLSERLSAYEYQAAGTAYDVKGRSIGGVRHQFKETKDGFKVRNLVEFPSLMPGSMLQAHEMHLACEFSNWLRMILEEKDQAGAAAN